jgi:DNA-binding transcriptional LysR family regulator
MKSKSRTHAAPQSNSQSNAQSIIWRDLALVLALVEEGSTLAAAMRLGVSQSTASRQLADAEYRFRSTLFHRHAHGIKPTPVGELIAKHALF